jgi:competence protein ComEC
MQSLGGVATALETSSKSYTGACLHPATDAANTGWRLAMLGAAWPAGAAIQLREATLQAMPVYVGCMVLGLLLVAAATLAGRRSMVAALGLMVLAFGVTGGRASIRLAETLPITLEARDLQVTGWVSSLPQRSSNGLRFRFEVEQATLDGQPITVPGVVSLGWYAGFQDGAGLTAGQLRLRAGQLWQFTVRLRRPHGLSNPHGFDQELRWFEDGVRATGSVRDAPAPRLLDGAVAHPIERLRQHVRDAVEASVVDRAPRACWLRGCRDQSSISAMTGTVSPHRISHGFDQRSAHRCSRLSAAAIGAMWRRSERAMHSAPSAGCGVDSQAALYAVFSGWACRRSAGMLARLLAAQRGIAGRTLVLLAAATQWR